MNWLNRTSMFDFGENYCLIVYGDIEKFKKLFKTTEIKRNQVWTPFLHTICYGNNSTCIFWPNSEDAVKKQ